MDNISKKINIKSIMMTIVFMLSLFVVCAAQPFNVEIELPNNYKDVNPGEEVWFTINLLNLDNLNRLDVTLNSDIVDSNGNSIVHNSKTVAIETQASFVTSLQIPENTLPGDYKIVVTVESSLGESFAKTTLKVSKEETDLTIYYYGASILGLIIIIFILIKSKHLFERIGLRMKISGIVRRKLHSTKEQQPTPMQPKKIIK